MQAMIVINEKKKKIRLSATLSTVMTKRQLCSLYFFFNLNLLREFFAELPTASKTDFEKKKKKKPTIFFLLFCNFQTGTE